MTVSDNQLGTAEQYLLAQLLVCGALTRDEFQEVTDFRRTVREERLDRLREKGILEETLYQDNAK